MVFYPVGVFSWITLNYLLGRLSPKYQHPPDLSREAVDGESGGDSEKPPQQQQQQQSISTVGCIDMGGASLQVAFEVPVDVSQSSSMSREVVCNWSPFLCLGCRNLSSFLRIQVLLANNHVRVHC